MSFVSFAVMPPASTMSMIDNTRWRVVVYADTPKSLARYRAFLSGPTDARKVAVIVFGVTSLRTVLKDKDRFTSILVFDDVYNLAELKSQMGVQMCDTEERDGVLHPKFLTPVDLASILDTPSVFPESTFLTQVTQALGNRRPSVLETTNRVPAPLDVEDSGLQRILAEIRPFIEESLFTTALNVYCKYVFRMVDRNFVTQNVTKKLPSEVKDLWKKLLDYADSKVGETMFLAFARLCSNKDPSYRAGHAVSDFDLRAYSGDFLYLTTVMPPLESYTFIASAPSRETNASTLNTSWTPPPEPPVAAKSKKKKSKIQQ